MMVVASARNGRRLAAMGAVAIMVCAARDRALAADAGVDGGGDGGTAPVPWCEDDVAVGPLRIYLSGAAKDYVGYFGQQLAQGSTPVTLIYLHTGSCQGIDAIVNPDPSKRVIAGTATFVDAQGKEHPCNVKAPAGTDAGTLPQVDVGVADAFAASCGYQSLPADVGDFWGPVSPIVFVTSPTSTQQAISSEIAYTAFGVNNGKSTPWVDPKFLMTRGPLSGSQQLAAHAINVPADQWWGTFVGATGNDLIHSRLAAATGPDAEKGLGVLSAAYAKSFGADVKPLAFQAAGQIAAFWPGSTQVSTDMRNVRDGHYVPWGVLHFFARLTNGQPSATASLITSRLTAILPDKALIDLSAERSTIPQCAMKVRRTEEVGALQPFKPTASCACYFEQKATGAVPASCTPCTRTSDCPSSRPACNYGFCEEQ
jgi:hypothetical protein